LLLPLLLVSISLLTCSAQPFLPVARYASSGGGGANNIALVGSNFGGVSDGTTPASRAYTMPQSVTSGNNVIVLCATASGTMTYTAGMLAKTGGTATVGTIVLDGGTNATSPNLLGLGIYRVPITGSGTLTLTFTPTSSRYSSVSAAEFSNIASVNTFGFNGGQSATETTGSQAGGSPGMIFYGATENSSATWTRTYSDTLIFNDAAASTDFTAISQFKLISSSPNTLTSTTESSSIQWVTAWVIYNSN